MWIRLDTIPQCDRQTDITYQYHERVCWCVKKNQLITGHFNAQFNWMTDGWEEVKVFKDC